MTTVLAGGGGRNPWVFVFTGFVTLFFGVTLTHILFNFLLQPFETEFGWSQLAISSAMSIFWLCDGVSLLMLGYLISKYGIRISVPPALLYGIAIMALSLMPHSIFALYILFGLMGLGAGAIAPTVYSIVITAWFEEHRGLALGVINAGMGLGGVLLPYLFAFILRVGDWRMLVVSIGLTCAILPGIAYTWILHMPPQWEEDRRKALRERRPATGPLTPVLASRQFWLLTIAVFLVSAATIGIWSKVIAVAKSHGVDEAVTVAALSSVSLGSVFMRFFVGMMLDHIFAPVFAFIVFLLCAFGVYLLMTAANHAILLDTGALLLGLGLGAEGDIIAYIVSRYVAKSLYSQVFGFMLFVYAMGGALGIYILSYCFSLTGSFTLGLKVIIGMVVVSALCFLVLGPYKRDLAGNEIVRYRAQRRVALDRG
jgi:MFS family permease